MITRAQADEAMKPIWDIKDQMYEETKDMTLDEWFDYIRRESEAGFREMEEMKHNQCDLSFLHKKEK